MLVGLAGMFEGHAAYQFVYSLEYDSLEGFWYLEVCISDLVSMSISLVRAISRADVRTYSKSEPWVAWCDALDRPDISSAHESKTGMRCLLLNPLRGMQWWNGYRCSAMILVILKIQRSGPPNIGRIPHYVQPCQGDIWEYPCEGIALRGMSGMPRIRSRYRSICS